METQISINGYLVGDLWWPIGAEAWKGAIVDVTRERSRICGDDRATLRDVVDLYICENGGDFSTAALLASAELTATRTTIREGRRVTVRRSWPLSAFPSVADYCHPDEDWLPIFDCDD